VKKSVCRIFDLKVYFLRVLAYNIYILYCPIETQREASILHKKGLVIGTICILMLVSLPISISDTNDNISIPNNGKHIVYFRGNNLDHLTTNNGIINTPFHLILIFRSEINDFVNFYFRDKTGEIDTLVRIINNGQPTVYNKDVYIEFDLSTKNSFVIFLTPFLTPLKNIVRGFVICDSVSIYDL